MAPVDAALRWLDGFSQNFSTEMIGAAITFILLEILLAGRREKEAEQREKERLILQMGSPDKAFAVEAARQLGARGWLEDGSLERAILGSANLQGADLSGANLQGADLSHTDLHGALCLAPQQLRQAGTLAGATLSDGTKLPDDDTWRSAFEAWCETVEVDEIGHIVPAPPED